jgi:hypothetical protein
MRYTILDRQRDDEEDESLFYMRVIQKGERYGAAWLPIEESDYQQINVGDVIEMLISVVPKEAVDAQ